MKLVQYIYLKKELSRVYLNARTLISRFVHYLLLMRSTPNYFLVDSPRNKIEAASKLTVKYIVEWIFSLSENVEELTNGSSIIGEGAYSYIRPSPLPNYRAGYASNFD